MATDRIDELRKQYPDFARGYDEGRYAFEAGRLLRSFRASAGLSQKALAERLGISQPRIAKAERGEGRDGPSYAYMKRVAEACGVEWPAEGRVIAKPGKPGKAAGAARVAVARDPKRRPRVARKARG